MSPNAVKVQDSLRDSLHMGQYANNKEGLQERLTVRHSLGRDEKKYCTAKFLAMPLPILSLVMLSADPCFSSSAYKQMQ